jgi:hypothetical protein
MSQIHKQVNGSANPSESCSDKEKEAEKTLAQENHDPALLQVLAQELDCDVKDIYDFELFVLFHTSPVNWVGKLIDWEVAREIDRFTILRRVARVDWITSSCILLGSITL